MEKNNKRKFYLALVLFSLIGQIAWVMENMYFNVFISEEFGASQYHVALMVSLSAIVATLTTLLIGSLSDKLGKRKIFICLGYITWGLSIVSFSLLNTDLLGKVAGSVAGAMSLGITLTIVLDCVMTFFGSTANDACFNAWLTDSTDETNRGKVEGINSMMPLIAILIVFGALSGFASHGSWWLLFSIIGGLSVIVGILGFFLIKDQPLVVNKEEKYFKRIVYGFKPSAIKENKMLYLVYLAFALFGIAIQIFMTFLIQYYIAYIPGQVLGFDKYVFVMAPCIIAAAVFTAIYGRLYDKYHYNKTIIPSLVILIVGLSLLSFTFLSTNIVLIIIGSLFLMCGYLSSSAIFNARMRDLTPKDKVGSFQGIKMFAQVLIPMLIGPWIGAASISGDFSYNMENVLVPDEYSYAVNPGIFIGALVVIIITMGIIFITFRIEKKKKNEE